jgi:RND family efflux transporter MFP subunit
MKPSHKASLPAVVLMCGVLATTALVAVHPEETSQVSPAKPPLVRLLEIQPRTARLVVRAHGIVEPRTESELVIEVAGRIVWVSPNLDEGGFFQAGETLVRIDKRDQEMEAERASASVERAESRLDLARATLERRRSLERAGVGSAASLDEAHSAERVAKADLRETRAALSQAELALARTDVTAPFEGRVRQKHVDVGQFVARGTPAARVYAVDYAEVRLPIPNEEMAFLDLPLGYREEQSADVDAASRSQAQSPGLGVTLVGSFAGREHRWPARLVRTEGALDPKTRMVNVIARVENPYGRDDDSERPPLPVGLFVEAEIEGRAYDAVFQVPRSALRGRDQVVVIDDESRMHSRRVDVLRADGDTVWLRDGLAAGERVCISPLEVVVEGMKVRSSDADAAEERAAESSRKGKAS